MAKDKLTVLFLRQLCLIFEEDTNFFTFRRNNLCHKDILPP